ncbi:hypothetical protein Leryth_021033 [Lithospermum erythrorhizon]|nr:hypothetical protein Leryth_021033 [Lithospermum erythrorhizon]
MKKIELKVDIHSDESRADLLKTVSKLIGIDQLSLNKEKGILTVIGDVDPVKVTKQIRKAKKRAEIISVGAPKKPCTSPSRMVMFNPCLSACSGCQVCTVVVDDPYYKRCTIV